MVSEDREIYVDTKYPIPPDVDGIIYVSPDELDLLEEEKDWLETEDEEAQYVIEDSEGAAETMGTPTPLGVEDQQVVYPVGGAAQVHAVLLIEEVPYVSDYEIRIVPRQ